MIDIISLTHENKSNFVDNPRYKMLIVRKPRKRLHDARNISDYNI